MLGIWEASVRASHHFLTEDDIRSLCPQAEEAIRQIETLWVVEDENVRIGFMGIQSGKIEMLFLHPDYFRKGIGRMLIQKAFSELDVQYVDVNEQNPSAVRFYERMGFRTFRRDSTDDQGNPFPILRMKRLFDCCFRLGLRGNQPLATRFPARTAQGWTRSRRKLLLRRGWRR